MAYPKTHTQRDISDIYRFAFHTKGVFVNPALQEPFGLTLIEAAANGVPIVATKNGGPVDIVDTLKNGILVDPLDADEIGRALFNLVTNAERWEQYSQNGLNNIHKYSWTNHCMRYLQLVEEQRNLQVMVSAPS